MRTDAQLLTAARTDAAAFRELYDRHATAIHHFHLGRSRDADAALDDLKGTVEATVDATKHVNGGCRSLTSDGREWQCYLGQAAVDQKIVSAGFLGEYAPSPGVG